MAEISIIVPVYNAESYLPACIDSILAQTFPDFELILVNDGSPDNCGAICEAYARKDNRIRVLHQKNQGQAAARNHALEIAGGSWICYVDSDDLIHPQMVETLREAIRSGAGDISMCAMLESPALPEGFFEPRSVDFVSYPVEESSLTALFDREEYPGWVACAKLIPKTLIESYPFQPGRVYEDNEAVCRWICGARKLAISDAQLYFYRTNPVSTTQSAFSPKKLDYLWALESIIRFYHAKGWKAMTERFCTRYAEAAAGCHSSVLRKLNRRDMARNIRRDVRRMFWKDKLPLTKKQFETMLEAMYPRLIRVYWPAEAVVRTLREKGLRALFQKIKKQLMKGGGQ